MIREKERSLVELLIDVAIIAILAGCIADIKCPEDQQVLRRGRLKQVALATIMYADDHNDKVIQFWSCKLLVSRDCSLHGDAATPMIPSVNMMIHADRICPSIRSVRSRKAPVTV